MLNGFHEYTKSGRQKRASLVEVCNWILECWNEVTVDCVKNGFAKSLGIYNVLVAEEESIDTQHITDNLPDSFIEALQSFNIESDEEFDGFE